MSKANKFEISSFIWNSPSGSLCVWSSTIHETTMTTVATMTKRKCTTEWRKDLILVFAVFVVHNTFWGEKKSSKDDKKEFFVEKRMKKRTRAQDNILCWYYFSVDPHHTISFIFQRYFNLEINNDNDNHDVLVEFCRSFGFVPPHKLRLFKMIKSKSKSPSWKYQRHTHEPTNISFGVLHPLMPSLPTFIF